MEEAPVKIRHGWRYHAKEAVKDLFEFALVVMWFLIILVILPESQQTKLSAILNDSFGFVEFLVWFSFLLICTVLAAVTKSILSFSLKLIKLLFKQITQKKIKT